MMFLCPGCHKIVEIRELEEEIDIYDGYTEVKRVIRCPECGFKLVTRVRTHRREVPWRTRQVVPFMRGW